MLRIDQRHDTAPPTGHGLPPVTPAPPAPPGYGGDDGRARRELRRQICRLEAELGDALIASFPRAAVDVRVGAPGSRAASRGPRMLELSELEMLRDDLADKLWRARIEIAERGEAEERNRELLERMLRDPKRYRFARLRNRDLGEDGCGVWEVRPRLGLIGMLAGWWHVKLSSGCPLRPVASRPMGKRSRKRSASGTAPRPVRPAAGTEARSAAPGGRTPGTPVSHRAKLDEAPPALWAPVPLTELAVFVGLILAIVGFVTGAVVALGAGIALVSLAAIELSVREHFAGYRSHTALLSALAAVLAAAGIYLTPFPQEGLLVVGALVFAGAFHLLRTAFARRAGGITFRV